MSGWPAAYSRVTRRSPLLPSRGCPSSTFDRIISAANAILSVLLQLFQRFLRHFVFGIQFQRTLKFIGGFFHFVLLFEESPYPCMYPGRPRISRSNRGSLRVCRQQSFGSFQVFFLQDQRNASVKLSSGITWRHAFPGVGDRQQ